jgi:paraquat-inducible protein A
MTRSPPSPPSDAIGCPHCGLVQRVPETPRGSVLECVRCGNTLSAPAAAGIDVSLAFSVAALVLMLPAALSPLMSLASFGAQRRDWLPTGVEVLWNDGFPSLATVVFFLSIVIPFVYLGLMVYVLGAVRLGIAAPLGKLFRWAGELRPWAMIEVYLVGCCVAYTRLQDVGEVHIGHGGWCLMASAFAVLLATATLDEDAVWAALSVGDEPARSRRTLRCDTCGLLLDAKHEHSECPRCGAMVRRRKPAAIQRTLALVVAGFLLYLPANVVPILSIERFGRVEPNTILGGVRELIASGLWPLAILVFAASILVPLVKLCGLSLMLLMTHLRSRRWLVGRTQLYRFIDFIGRWSSIDLFMISILVALVQFGNLTRVRPQGGAVAFAAVVVITMLASRCFDPRVMWDAPESGA